MSELRELRRIADALERMSPPPPKEPKEPREESDGEPKGRVAGSRKPGRRGDVRRIR